MQIEICHVYTNLWHGFSSLSPDMSTAFSYTCSDPFQVSLFFTVIMGDLEGCLIHICFMHLQNFVNTKITGKQDMMLQWHMMLPHLSEALKSRILQDSTMVFWGPVDNAGSNYIAYIGKGQLRHHPILWSLAVGTRSGDTLNSNQYFHCDVMLVCFALHAIDVNDAKGKKSVPSYSTLI